MPWLRFRLIALSLFTLCLSTAAWAAEGNPPPELSLVQGRIQEALARMDAALAKASLALARTGLAGAGASRTLQGLCEDQPLAIDCSTIDARGVMVVVEPAHFKNVEGADISEQPQVASIKQYHQPVMSRMFPTVEGMHAVDLERPVLDLDGGYLGSVSIIFDPDKLVERSLKGLEQARGRSFFLVQDNGLLLYHADPRAIGGFATPPPARWVTVGLHGTLWRLGMAIPTP